MKLVISSETESIRDICSFYWELNEDGSFTHTVTSIAKLFKKNSHEITKINKQYCQAYSKNICCYNCGAPYIYNSRSDYQSCFNNNDYSYKCNACIEKEILDETEEKISRLSKYYNISKPDPFDLNSLSFRDAIFLLAIIKYQASEDLEYLKPYTSNQKDMLSPSDEYDLKIYKHLAENNIIILSPRTELTALKLTDNGSFQYRIDQACWEIPVDNRTYPEIKIFIQQLEKKLSSIDWEDSWYSEAKELGKEIALQESLAYLNCVMTEHQFNFSVGEKTILVLNKILEQCSVAQSYNLIWGAAKDAAAYYMRSNTPKAQAANSVVGGIERKFERYLANNWEIKAFRRDFRLPISIVSQVLFNTTLHTDDGGFNKVVNKII